MAVLSRAAKQKYTKYKYTVNQNKKFDCKYESVILKNIYEYIFIYKYTVNQTEPRMIVSRVVHMVWHPRGIYIVY